MATLWDIWQRLGIYGSALGDMVVPWDIWQRLGIYGSDLGDMATPWDIWQRLGIYGNALGYMATPRDKIRQRLDKLDEYARKSKHTTRFWNLRNH